MELDSLLTNILESTSEIIKKCCAGDFSVKSLWLFRHIPEINSFKTWKYFIVKQRLQSPYSELNSSISDTVIPESVGTIGKVYDGKKWFLELNTYGAQEGTVIEIDLRMEHQSVLFVPIEDTKNDIISILLVSISPHPSFLNNCSNNDNIINEIKKSLSDPLKKEFIYDKIRFAYEYQRNKDVIDNFKKSRLDQDVLSFSPDDYLREYLIAPLINSQAFKIPVIEINGSTLNNSIFAISDSAYNIYENTKKTDY